MSLVLAKTHFTFTISFWLASGRRQIEPDYYLLAPLISRSNPYLPKIESTWDEFDGYLLNTYTRRRYQETGPTHHVVYQLHTTSHDRDLFMKSLFLNNIHHLEGAAGLAA
jgi:hypothetical protein